MTPEIRICGWSRGTPDDERAGLLAYVTLTYGELQLDGVTVRRTSAGRICLSFPARTDRAGRRHAIVRPVDDAARVALEHEVLRQLAAHAGGEEPSHD